MLPHNSSSGFCWSLYEEQQQVWSQEVCFQSNAWAEGQSPPCRQVRCWTAVMSLDMVNPDPSGNSFSLVISDLEGAADVAIERKNESEMGAVLSRCSASDRVLIDRLNRARASTTKKWSSTTKKWSSITVREGCSNLCCQKWDCWSQSWVWLLVRSHQSCFAAWLCLFISMFTVNILHQVKSNRLTQLPID